MDYIGLAIVLGGILLSFVDRCHMHQIMASFFVVRNNTFTWNVLGGVVLVMFLGSCCCAACVWCMQQVCSCLPFVICVNFLYVYLNLHLFRLYLEYVFIPQSMH